MNSQRINQAMNEFTYGLLCSQSILLAFAEDFGLDYETALKISRPFGSGIARTGATCGAVTGAYMVIGLLCQEDDDKLAKEKTFSLVEEFNSRFVQKYKAINCKDLINCNLGTAEGQQYFKDNNLIVLCKGYVQGSAQILEELIQETKG